MSTLEVSWVDVFTDRPFAGNPLAVVLAADDLDTRQMQTLAHELNLSETVFVNEAVTAIRIFTPTAELPLAGHPVIGTALELARRGLIDADGRSQLMTGAGEIAIEVSGGAATMTQGDLEVGAELDPEAVRALLRLDAGATIIGAPTVCTTTGIHQAFVQLADRGAVAAVRPDIEAIRSFAEADGLAVWCEHRGELAQRFFAPRIGVIEDPATGSAAGALGALRVLRGAEPGRIVVRQGDEVRRPSTIDVTVGGVAGRPAGVQVGGRSALVLEATIATERLRGPAGAQNGDGREPAGSEPG